MIVHFSGIARIVEIKTDVYQAEILLDGNKSVIEFFGRGTQADIENRLVKMYPLVEVVPNQVFLCEMDHIKLFDERSDGQLWSAPMSDVDAADLQRILDEQQEAIKLLDQQADKR